MAAGGAGWRPLQPQVGLRGLQADWLGGACPAGLDAAAASEEAACVATLASPCSLQLWRSTGAALNPLRPQSRGIRSRTAQSSSWSTRCSWRLLQPLESAACSLFRPSSSLAHSLISAGAKPAARRARAAAPSRPCSASMGPTMRPGELGLLLPVLQRRRHRPRWQQLQGCPGTACRQGGLCAGRTRRSGCPGLRTGAMTRTQCPCGATAAAAAHALPGTR